MIIQRKTKLIFLIAALLLNSCATTENLDDADALQTDANNTGEITIEDPEALAAKGEIIEAAMLYLKIANKTVSPDRENLQLKGIHLLINEKSFDLANDLLAEMSTTKLNTNQLTHYAYLKTKIAINDRNSEQSSQWVALLKDKSYLKFTSKIDVLELMVSAYELASDTRSATLTRIELEPELSIETKIIANQQAIIRGLLSLSDETLQRLNETEDSPRTLIWLDLAALVKKSKNPFRLGNQLASWRERNPNNTIRDEVFSALAPQQTDEQIKIENIALLLPLSGPFEKPASAIRDGFLASYYAEDTLENRPTIRIYNSAAKNMSILETYQQALDEGANIVVGPLRKKAIRTLALNGNIQTPTLVLNQLEELDYYTENLYQFALSPEQEARQAAKRAWLDGHNRAAIIYPKNKWGNRVLTAFKDEWEKFGGEIVSENSYNSKKNDFSKPIKSLLAIDKSYERKRSISKLLRTKLRFDARRRQDIDFIFMATFPRQARLIPPQLKFFHAGGLPIYATSHSFSGKINRKKDRDLNGVIVGDMPWTLTGPENNNTKLQIYRLWPNKSKKYNRFYAFGSDTYHILRYLNWLRSNSLSLLEGETGKLHMNESNQILRELSWAKFKNGKPKLLPATARLDHK